MLILSPLICFVGRYQMQYCQQFRNYRIGVGCKSIRKEGELFFSIITNFNQTDIIENDTKVEIIGTAELFKDEK